MQEMLWHVACPLSPSYCSILKQEASYTATRYVSACCIMLVMLDCFKERMKTIIYSISSQKVGVYDKASCIFDGLYLNYTLLHHAVFQYMERVIFSWPVIAARVVSCQ